MKEHCQNCRFWDPIINAPDLGLCRRYPPSGQSEDTRACYPGTADLDWCGEWQRLSMDGGTKDVPAKDD